MKHSSDGFATICNNILVRKLKFLLFYNQDTDIECVCSWT